MKTTEEPSGGGGAWKLLPPYLHYTSLILIRKDSLSRNSLEDSVTLQFTNERERDFVSRHSLEKYHSLLLQPEIYCLGIWFGGITTLQFTNKREVVSWHNISRYHQHPSKTHHHQSNSSLERDSD